MRIWGSLCVGERKNLAEKKCQTKGESETGRSRKKVVAIFLLNEKIPRKLLTQLSRWLADCSLTNEKRLFDGPKF
jgi:hypothetical protein